MGRVAGQLSALSAISSAGSLGACPGASKEKGHSPVILRSFSFVQNMVLVASVRCGSHPGELLFLCGIDKWKPRSDQRHW